MSQLDEIRSVQKSLEENFTKKMDELQAQLQGGNAAKDTVAKVAEEFRSFREIVFNILGLLRKQISECARSMDAVDTWQRRKALIFTGIPEAQKENCTSVLIGILNNKMARSEITTTSIKTCHRLGTAKQGHVRPILVRFSSGSIKSDVWNSKTMLKGSPIAVKEFLTKTRQAVFVKARSHFGVRCCWIQDGVVIVKAPDGHRHKITTSEELDSLTRTHPKATLSGSTNTNPTVHKL